MQHKPTFDIDDGSQIVVLDMVNITALQKGFTLRHTLTNGDLVEASKFFENIEEAQPLAEAYCQKHNLQRCT